MKDRGVKGKGKKRERERNMGGKGRRKKRERNNVTSCIQLR